MACHYRIRSRSWVSLEYPLLQRFNPDDRRCVALYYRLTIPETPRYTFDVARDVEKAGEDTKAYIQGKAEGQPDEVRRVTVIADSEGRLETPKASFRDFLQHYGQWKFGKVLLGTAGSWFFLDVAFYGLGLNNSIILGAIGYSKGANMYEVFRRNAIGNLILVCAGAIPGYWVTVFTVDTLGRKPIQFMGFTMLTILFVVIGFAYDKLLKHNGALLALYVLAQFFFNFGTRHPNPKRYDRAQLTRPHRSQCDYLHRSWRMLPYSLSINVPRSQCGVRKARRYHCAGGVRSSPSKRSPARID